MEHGRLERRSSERFRTHLSGRIAWDDNARSIECIMHDLSGTGARLQFPNFAEIPLEFDLQISEEGASARARLIWTTGKEYGVMFID